MRKTNNWTKQEEELLLTCNNKTINEIKEMFPNRNEKGIYIKCSRLNIHISRENKWSDQEINIIKNNTHLSIKELIKLLPNRTYNAIQSRCKILGITLERSSSSWEQWEIDLIKNNQDKTLKEIYQLLNHKIPETIYSYIKTHGFKFKYNSEKYNVINGSMLCNKCAEYKPYNEIYFDLSRKNYHTCKECTNKMRNIQKYKTKYNIDLNFEKMFDTFTPEEWYDFYYEGRINKFPYEISRNKKYMSIIIKYAIKTILNKNSREDIISINTKDLKRIRLKSYIAPLGIYECLSNLYSEFQIKPWELKLTKDNFWLNKNNADDFIKWFIKINIDINNINIKLEIPNIFTINNMRKINNHKLNNCIQYYHHYSSYYEWLSTLFPEWDLTEEDFKLIIAKDGTKLNSMDELLIYEGWQEHP